MARFDLTPLFRTSVGFDRVSHVMNTAMELERQAAQYPPYNITKTGENDYRITLAVAGFSRDDLDITLEDRVLTVKASRTEEEDENVVYLHRGIAGRSFERRFTLADHIAVVDADLVDGLLHVQLQRVIPEALKPRRIEIGTREEAVAAK
ncbi:MAG: Hsp20 family protein [Deltaproteobacteria bacterium]|nr:MAG: Hsp20 family protein [Deltaproteobacteria bacterium]